MSQEKVQKYKEQKANRKKIIKKEKRLHVLRVIAYTLVTIAIVGFLGWSVYDKFIKEEPTQATLSQEEISSMLEEYMATSESGTTVEGQTTKKGETTSNKENSSDETTKKAEETTEKPEETTEKPEETTEKPEETTEKAE